ncbi:serine/threonine protein kinase [Paenibacillus polymyxa]|uniref:serine/threonine protein kinase n=1 Tax=Paenibacillus TaxID=44249 RepID=UPI000D309AD5|nr:MULTISPECIES: protein kinase [Paenibacillus]KAF6652355.1 protein kinase [Paenibacillus sp. EKM301P]PTU44553.1 serine/threonine protein kinase [Paenibacillus polymyxa]RPE10985.1 serine/threonine protein kinase [Paenibacillus polymyxa]UBS87718.1 protein kinase [Paenibacillus polymyxa]WHX36306.1 protein kinase [Paenibacillus polymyxa]
MFAWLRNIYESWIDYPKQPGDLLSGRYCVRSLLGMGSYGLTYLCLDRHSGQEVAVKLPRPSKRAQAVQLLQREAHIMRKMEHPYIPKLLEIDQHSDGMYMVMEYVSGMTLEELIFEQERSFTEQECIVYILELMERVLHVHERGYIHRDIRIPNVIHREGKPYLIDFGLALAVGERQEDVFTEAMLEKRAPERQDVAFYSDLYDVGHFMLFMLYSSYEPQPDQPPGSWQEELMLSQPVRHILERLFQIRPRYEHSRQFMQELEEALLQLEVNP